MEKLERKTSTFSHLIVITAACVGLAAQANQLFKTENAIYAVVCFWSLLVALWLIYGRRPAAWVHDDTLCIRDGHFKATSIPKENIEYVKYNKASKEQHELIIKMQNYSEWTIPIHDVKEHLKDDRLYHFIKRHFIEL